MAMQSRPGASLVMVQAQPLLAILMEALDGPTAMRQPDLRLQVQIVEPPGDVPFGLSVLTGEGALPDQPAGWPGGIAVGAPARPVAPPCPPWLPAPVGRSRGRAAGWGSPPASLASIGRGNQGA